MTSLHIKACRIQEPQSSKLKDVLLCWTCTAEAFEHCQNGFPSVVSGTQVHREFTVSSYTLAALNVSLRPHGQLPPGFGLLTVGDKELAQTEGFEQNVAKIQVL